MKETEREELRSTIKAILDDHYHYRDTDLALKQIIEELEAVTYYIDER